MHIPKTAGTSVARSLQGLYAGTPCVDGFDHFLFGAFRDFHHLPAALQNSIYADPGQLPAVAGLVAGHFSNSTLRAAYPTGRFMTLLREPVTRLLSHWLYWRQLSDGQLEGWGGWAERVKRARSPLADFLNDRDLACQTDNLSVRALLWPDRLIPNDGFIDPSSDRRLLRRARAELRRFDFVDIVENPDLRGRIERWVEHPMMLARENETARLPPDLRSPLAAELGGRTHELLERRSRLDLRLWRDLAGRRVMVAPTTLRSRVLMESFSRYGALMAVGR
jgi:hypothetical protein